MVLTDEGKGNLVARDHLLTTLAKLQHAVIFVEGESGCGSTTLLEQFRDAYQPSTFSLFVRPSSKISYSPDYLRIVLAEQFAAYLGVELSSGMGVDESEYRSLLLALRRRKSKQTVYFVVDGLQQIPPGERGVFEEIFSEVLPLGVDGFRLIVVGTSERFSPLIGKVASKSYVIPEFSPQEAELIFSGMQLGPDELKAIHRLCSGLPGRLAAVQRMLASGKTLSSVLAADPDSYLGFIEIEVGVAENLGDSQITALAALAFSRQALSIESLCRIFSLDQSDVTSMLGSCSFVHVDESGILRFQSETHRRAAERKLDQLKSKIFETQIDHLTKAPEAADAIEFLPSYMQAQQNQQAIIDLLQPEHYRKLLSSTKSLARLRARAGLGARSAAELNKARELFQFSLQRSIFQDLAVASECQAQVSALVALGQADRALDLASQAASTEARLRMLAAYGRGVKEMGGQLDEKVAAHIRELSDLVDLSESLEEAERLAENVAAFDPDLAITILDKPLQHGDRGSSRNQALAKLSINAAASGSENSEAILEKTSGQITDERLRTLVAVVADFYEKFDVRAVSKLIAPMEPARRIYFLRSAIQLESQNGPCLGMVDLALNELVGSISYVPKMKDFADLTQGLGRGGDQELTSDLIARIDSQLGLVASSGSTSDYVRVQMNIARAQMKTSRSAAVDRVIRAFDAVMDIDLPEIKVESLSIMYDLISDVDEEGLIDQEYGVSKLVYEELNKQIAALQRATAAHFEPLKGALVAMAKRDPESACALAVGLNTQLSRDAALKLVARSIVSSRGPSSLVDTFSSLLDAMSCVESRVDCLRGAIRVVPVSEYPRAWIEHMEELVLSCPYGNWTCAMGLALVKHQVKYLGSATSKALCYALAAADDLSDSAERVDALYSLVPVVAASDPVQAEALYERTRISQSALAIGVPSASRTVRTCLSLLLRGFRGLLKFDVLDEGFVSRFARLCDCLDDVVSKVAHVSDLATKAWCEQKVDLCRRILSDYVGPTIDSCPVESWKYAECRRFAFTPYYLSRGSSSFEMLDGLDRISRDDMLSSTVCVILRKVSEGDHWSGDDEQLSVTLEEAKDVLQLISQMRTDSFIYQSVASLCKALSSKQSKLKVAGHQRADVKARLEKIVEERLPDRENIRHEGYKIVALARLQCLTDSKVSDWQELLQSADALSNESDRLLVRMEIADCMPEKYRVDRKKILESMQDEIQSLPSAYDRFWRTQSFAEIAKVLDPPAARIALNTAFAVTFELGNLKDAEEYRRRIVNIAEMIDPKFADSFVQSSDDDPARRSAREALRVHAEINRTKRAISSPRSDECQSADMRNDVLPSAAWKAVGSLVSGKSAPLAPERLDRYVEVSGNWDLHDAFPVLSWYVENLSRKLNRSADVQAKLTPLIEAILLSTELAVSVISQVAGKEVLSVFQVPDNSPGLLMRPGAADDGVGFIFDWLSARSEGVSDAVLCDPFFSPSDLWFVMRFGAEVPDCELRILTSAKAMRGVTQEDLERAWHAMSDQTPPLCSVLVVRTDVDERSPIHDRWLLLSNAGLRLGTSLGGMGNRLSEISEVDEERAATLSTELGAYLAQKRAIHGQRLEYSLLKLG